MPLESATYISDLDSANPAATDLLSQGDDHIRLLKAVLKATFPNINGAVTLSDEDLNGLTALISGGGVPTGTIAMWYGSSGSVPSGWHICDGTTAIPKASGVGTIDAPDLRDKVVMGVGTLQATPGGAYGAATASATSGSGGSHSHLISGGGTHTHPSLAVQGHALTISEMPAHSHTFTHGGPGSEVEGGEGGNTLTKTTSTVGGGAAHSHGISQSADGSHTHTSDTAAAHTHSVTVGTYQPAVALHYIIKL